MGEPTWQGDYEALRAGAGALAIRRDVLRLSGPDAVGFLQGQCSQDVEAMEVGSSADALLLSPEGRLDALVRVLRTGDTEVLVDVEGGFGEAVRQRLLRFRLRTKVEIEPVPSSCVALRGPALTSPPEGSGDHWAAPFRWGGITGWDVFGPDPTALVPAGTPWCDPRAWDALRIEAGIPVMGRELDDRTIPAEADLVTRAVSFTKGCYTGQELVARIDSRGNRVPRRLRGVVPASAVDPEALAVAEIFSPDGERSLGRCRSASWCPAVGSAAALGYVHRGVEPPGQVRLVVDDGASAAAGIVAEIRTLPLA